jgi:hypothetical protein
MRAATKLGLILTLAISMASCATLNSGSNGDSAAPGQQVGAQADAQPVPPAVIPEFGDIPIPRALTRQNDQSFIYEAPGTVIGVLVYAGRRIDPDSINGFFREQMPLHGWRLLNAFRDENTDLFYLKDNRSCQISIKPGMIDTKVIIKVGPTASGSGPAGSPNGS